MYIKVYVDDELMARIPVEGYRDARALSYGFIETYRTGDHAYGVYIPIFADDGVFMGMIFDGERDSVTKFLSTKYTNFR